MADGLTSFDSQQAIDITGMQSIGEGDEKLYFTAVTESYMVGETQTTTTYYGPAGYFVYEEVLYVSNYGGNSSSSRSRYDANNNELEYERVYTWDGEISREEMWTEELENGNFVQYRESDSYGNYSLETTTYDANFFTNNNAQQLGNNRVSIDQDGTASESGQRNLENVYADIPDKFVPDSVSGSVPGYEYFSREITNASIDDDGNIVEGNDSVVIKESFERYDNDGNFIGSLNSEDGVEYTERPDPDNPNDRISETGVSSAFLDSLEDATADGWVNYFEYYVGTGGQVAIFSDDELANIVKVGHVENDYSYDYTDDLGTGAPPAAGDMGGGSSTNIESTTTYLDAANKIFMVIDYSLNESSDYRSEMMNVTRYDANGDIVETANGYEDESNYWSGKSFDRYDGNGQFLGGEETEGNTTQVFDENWNVIDSYVSFDAADKEAVEKLGDAAAIELINEYYNDAVFIISDFKEFEEDWGFGPVVTSSGTATLLNGSDEVVGLLSVWEQYSDGERQQRSVEMMDSSGDHFGYVNEYGNSVSLNLTKKFDGTQSGEYVLNGDPVTFDYTKIETWTNEELAYNEDGSIASRTVVESSTYYYLNEWEMVYGEWSSGVLTTQYGEGWQVIGTTSNIDLDDLIPVSGQEGVYQHVSVKVHEDDYAMPGMGNGGASTNTETKTLIGKIVDGAFVITGRIEEYRWESEDKKQYNVSSNEFDADGNVVSSSWSDSYGNQGSFSSVIEIRDIDGSDVEVLVESGSNGHDGWFYAYEYVYDQNWNFLEGYEVNNGQKTSYGKNWERLETSVTIDESQKDALDEVTEAMSVLDSFAETAVYRGVAGTYSDSFGNGTFSQTTYQFFNKDYEILYTEELNTWEDSSDYSSVSSNYQNADGEWLGSSYSDSEGSESLNLNYTNDDGNRVESGSFKDGDGWSETYEYVYDQNYSLISGKLEQNGLVTVYGANWEVESYGLDPDGKYTFEAVAGTNNYEVRLGEQTEEGDGQVRILVLDGNSTSAKILESKEVWRWTDPSGFWSEHYSIYDAEGNWIGSGSEDSFGFYYESSESIEDVTIDGTEYLGVRVSSSVSGNAEENWSESSTYYYASDWTFLGGSQTQNGVKTTYDEYWNIISTEVVINEDELIDIFNDSNELIGYAIEQSLGGNYGAMPAGGGIASSENQDTRILYLNLDKKVTGSKEIFYWDDGFGRTSVSETYYDENGNWLSSSYESSDGYQSSYSQEVLTGDNDEVTGYVSSGTSVDPDGSSHSYQYTYDKNWSLVEGWELRDDVRIEYGPGWVETGQTVVERNDVVYTDVRDDLGNLIGYTTKKVIDEADGQEGVSAKTTTTRFYDTDKEFTGYKEQFVYRDATYRTKSVTEYDKSNNIVSEKYEDSEGFAFEENTVSKYDEDGVTLISYVKSGQETNPEGKNLEWSYNYDSEGNFTGGRETYEGATTRYDANWNVISVQGNVTALDAVTDADGTVTGYYNEGTNEINDQFGLFSLEETVRQEYSTTGTYLQQITQYVRTVDGETTSGTKVENSNGEVVYSQSEDQAGNFSITGTYADSADVNRDYFMSVDENGLSGSIGLTSEFFDENPGENDDGVVVSSATSTVSVYVDGIKDEGASYKYTAEFFGELLALDGWTINETAFTANSQVELSDEMTALYTDAAQLDDFAEGTSTKLILANLLKDYSYIEMLDNDLAANGSDADKNPVTSDEQKGSALAGSDATGSYIIFDSNASHGMVLRGDFNKVDPNSQDNSSAKTQLASGNITSIKIYSAQENGSISQDADNVALEISNIRLGLATLYNNLDELVPDDGETIINAARYDIA